MPKHGRAAGLHPLNLRLPSWLPGSEKSVSPSRGTVNGNSEFFFETFLTYSFMLANGFTDAWSRTHPFRIFSGATCCQDNLQDSMPHLTQRLDQVFVRNQVSVVGAQLVDQFDLTSSFWPSDHAAVLVGAIP